MRRVISPTSSRNIVPVSADLELAGLVAVGAGEAALDVAEQLRFEQRLGQAGAVHRDERLVHARLTVVDGAGDEFLADAALAGDQDLGVGARDALDLLLQLHHLGADADERCGLWVLHACGPASLSRFSSQSQGQSANPGISPIAGANGHGFLLGSTKVRLKAHGRANKGYHAGDFSTPWPRSIPAPSSLMSFDGSPSARRSPRHVADGKLEPFLAARPRRQGRRSGPSVWSDQSNRSQAPARRSEPMLNVTGVLKRYEGQDRAAVDNVSFSVTRGEFVALMGPSGCGKSTLLHLCGAMDRPDRGRHPSGRPRPGPARR